MKQPTKSVLVAMSGGVDSSVSAALLKQRGYEVIGVMLRLWSPPGESQLNRCCSPDAMALARQVAAKLEIPFYVLDARDEFYEQVVKGSFLAGYLKGITPNPCLTCNRFIRWGMLYDYARTIGMEHFATGHYAQIRFDEAGNPMLMKGKDIHKDQSYVLHVLSKEQLKKTIFPIGDKQKAQVREFAQEFNLPVAHRKDSQDLCFLGNEDYRDFIANNQSTKIRPGKIVTTSGEVVGEHNGLPFYTIGQRKGLNINRNEPFYVIHKDTSKNELVVGVKEERGGQKMLVRQLNWIMRPPSNQTFEAEVKIRYKSPAYKAKVICLSDREVEVLFAKPVNDITPGQAAVFYQGDICLGGGLIAPGAEI